MKLPRSQPPTLRPTLPAGPHPPYLRVQGDGCTLSVKVQPRAPRNAIVGPQGDHLRIRVAAPPVDSAANQELIEFLAGALGLPRGAVTILRGHTATLKVIRCSGVTADRIIARLAAS